MVIHIIFLIYLVSDQVYFLYIYSQNEHKILNAGYWIGGFGIGESTDERSTLLNAVIVRLFSTIKAPFLPMFLSKTFIAS